MLNWRMLSHPMNYLVVGVMVLISSIAVTILLNGVAGGKPADDSA